MHIFLFCFYSDNVVACISVCRVSVVLFLLGVSRDDLEHGERCRIYLCLSRSCVRPAPSTLGRKNLKIKKNCKLSKTKVSSATEGLVLQSARRWHHQIFTVSHTLSSSLHERRFRCFWLVFRGDRPAMPFWSLWFGSMCTACGICCVACAETCSRLRAFGRK